MPIYYDSKKIVPAPFVSIQKNYDRASDGHKVGSRFTIVVKGTMLACKGSPNSEGVFYTGSGYPPDSFETDPLVNSADKRLKSLEAKMQAMRTLFARDGKSFEIQPYDGSAPLKCYPRVQGIEFEDGERNGFWYDYVKYTVTLEADEMFGLNTADNSGAEDAQYNEDYFKDSSGVKLFLQDVSENWSLEVMDDSPENDTNPYTYRLTHTVNAKGKRTYDDTGLVSEAWQQAKRWVTTRLGLDTAYYIGTDGIQAPADILAFNHIRQEATDKFEGTYSVTENWILAKGNTREDFTVSTETSTETNLTTVSIEGEVIGMDSRDTSYAITTSKWTAALAKFTSLTSGVTNTIFTRAQTYSGASLNTTPLRSSSGRNPVTGRISYNYSYDTRPTNCISGALSERIEIDDTLTSDVFASIPIIGRLAGPLLQDMNTVTELKRTVHVEVVMPVATGCFTSIAGVTALMSAAPTSQVQTVFDAFRGDLALTYNQIFEDRGQPHWEPRTGRYSRSVTWTFQNCP